MLDTQGTGWVMCGSLPYTDHAIRWQNMGWTSCECQSGINCPTSYFLCNFLLFSWNPMFVAKLAVPGPLTMPMREMTKSSTALLLRSCFSGCRSSLDKKRPGKSIIAWVFVCLVGFGQRAFPTSLSSPQLWQPIVPARQLPFLLPHERQGNSNSSMHY